MSPNVNNKIRRHSNLKHWICLTIVASLLLASIPSRVEAPCAMPDLPTCACYALFCEPIGSPWPLSGTMGDLIETARATVGLRTCCIKHGGQAYWQVQRQLAIPEAADALAFIDTLIQTNDETDPEAWCTEAVAFWAREASIPYAWGYYAGHNRTSFIKDTGLMRVWYKTEDSLLTDGALARGRWIDSGELDYANFEPGVNGPCPGAYQQIQGFIPPIKIGDDYKWDPFATHSLLIDSMVVYRLDVADGPVQQIDIKMIDGNIYIPGSNVWAEVIDTRWYRDIIDFTTIGPDSMVLGNSNAKIRGWGINLNPDGTVYCDSSRIEDVIIHAVLTYPAPQAPDNSDSARVAAIVTYYNSTGGAVTVTTNSTTVYTGGALPDDTNYWTIPPPPHPEDPVCIELDFLAEYPVGVDAITLEWTEEIPRQFEVWWADETATFQSTTVTLPTSAPTVPSGTVLPLPVPFATTSADTGQPVRYIRLCIPQSVLTRTYQVQGFHFNYFTTEVEDSNNSHPPGGAGDPPPTGIATEDVPPAGLWLRSGVPNPFQAQTSVTFDLPEAGHIRLAVYDVLGRRVKVLLEGVVDEGSRTVFWDGRSASGRDSPSGVYFVRLEWRGQVRTQKLVLAR